LDWKKNVFDPKAKIAEKERMENYQLQQVERQTK
jgi:hypothetical protein